MTADTLPVWLALAIQIGLGLAVLRANPRSHSNQAFLLISVFIALWLLSLELAYTASTARIAEVWIRNATSAGILILVGFNALRLAIVHRDQKWRQIIAQAWLWLLIALLGVALCYSHWFLQEAVLRRGTSAERLIPQPIYGPLYPVIIGGISVAVVLIYAFYFRAMRRTVGIAKVELQFVAAGGLTLFVFAVLGILMRPVLSAAVAARLTPLRAVVFSLIIAYAIATRKLMEVGFFFRRVMGYVVLTAYLLMFYAAFWWLVFLAVRPIVGGDARPVSHIAAALAVAFAMAPVRGLSQSLANRLFVGTSAIDFRETMNRAAAILRSVTEIEDLLQQFAKTVADAVRTDRVLILLRERDTYVQHYPFTENTAETPLTLNTDGALIKYLKANHEVVVLDELHRIRQTPEVERTIARMIGLRVAVALGVFAREELMGVMLLGTRISGRIYGRVEQNALSVLCGQLGVAIENAELFTEVQNARIYNETLLTNLTTGVVAIGADERVTVFNNEAAELTGYRPESVCGERMHNLPPTLAKMLQATLRTGTMHEENELLLESPRGAIVTRASSTIFHGKKGRMLGALLVLTDITAIKRLEAQLRRSDRLASIGTLSAGMAHEIKNPLVSIKTFAQLLPERYNDSDFRETFSKLIGHEIDRIDSLVNQLLRFARPTKPLLQPMHAHEVLEKSLQLVGARLYQKEIQLTRLWKADVDTIRADADQLEQVFLNFFINAMDAMKAGGTLTVSTDIQAPDSSMPMFAGRNGQPAVEELLRITIRDTGVGIRKEDISHVFDPFFTTKDYGTGLGLSVVHGIVQEHGGIIEVESELKKGTAFHIFLPLARFEQNVRAA